MLWMPYFQLLNKSHLNPSPRPHAGIFRKERGVALATRWGFRVILITQ